MTIPVRGLRTLRTMSGKADHKAAPYRAYMQITCLEMEKARRHSERQSAARRIAEIDSRLLEIEAEKAALLQALSEPSSAKAPLPGTIVRNSGRPRSGTFRIRY